MAELIEIRSHGRGGQGVVTAGKLLVETALDTGLYFQAFPDYGPERMGATSRPDNTRPFCLLLCSIDGIIAQLGQVTNDIAGNSSE